MARKPADPEEELRWMSQEVRGYVEAVLNSLAANVPKVKMLYFTPLLSINEIFHVTFVSDRAGRGTLPSRESKGRHAQSAIYCSKVIYIPR